LSPSVVRVLVTNDPAFKSQHGTPSTVAKNVEPHTLVHAMPAVPLRAGMASVVGSMPALAASRASSSEMTDGDTHPVYPAAHTSHVSLV